MDDVELLLDMAKQENDAEAMEEVVADLDKFTAQIEEMEFRRMFSGEMDPEQCISRYPVWFRRYRSPGLGGNAAAHVPALGRTTRLRYRSD